MPRRPRRQEEYPGGAQSLRVVLQDSSEQLQRSCRAQRKSQDAREVSGRSDAEGGTEEAKNRRAVTSGSARPTKLAK